MLTVGILFKLLEMCIYWFEMKVTLCLWSWHIAIFKFVRATSEIITELADSFVLLHCEIAIREELKLYVPILELWIVILVLIIERSCLTTWLSFKVIIFIKLIFTNDCILITALAIAFTTVISAFSFNTKLMHIPNSGHRSVHLASRGDVLSW